MDENTCVSLIYWNQYYSTIRPAYILFPHVSWDLGLRPIPKPGDTVILCTHMNMRFGKVSVGDKS